MPPLNDKDILITPAKGSSTANPSITFIGATVGSSSTITVSALPTQYGTLDFTGVAVTTTIASIGELNTGTLFSVNNDAGLPALDVNETGLVNLSFNSGALGLPVGTTTQRPYVSQAGYTRWNNTNSALEIYNGTNWVEVITDYFPSGSTILG
jgi:hypothetical protein